MPDDFRASIHSSTSAKSQATFRLVSAIRRGNSPRCSMLKIVRSDSGIIASSFFRLMSVLLVVACIPWPLSVTCEHVPDGAWQCGLFRPISWSIRLTP